MTFAISSLSFLRAAPRRWIASRSPVEAAGPAIRGLRDVVADIGGNLRWEKRFEPQRHRGTEKTRREGIMQDRSLRSLCFVFSVPLCLCGSKSLVLHRIRDDVDGQLAAGVGVVAVAERVADQLQVRHGVVL